MEEEKVSLVDAHCHLYEFEEGEIKDFVKKGFVIGAVSDDLESSFETLKLAEKHPENIVAFVGLHPWEVGRGNKVEGLEKIFGRIVVDANVKVGLGEVGLDKKFTPKTFQSQKKVLTMFFNLAKEYSLPVNLHAAGAWKEAFELVKRFRLEKVLFHWFTGPLDLLEEIQDSGYFVSVNLALRVQEKSKKVVKAIELENLLTESDGPYEYRGLKFSPLNVEETLKLVSQIKNIEERELKKTIIKNFARFIA